MTANTAIATARKTKPGTSDQRRNVTDVAARHTGAGGMTVAPRRVRRRAAVSGLAEAGRMEDRRGAPDGPGGQEPTIERTTRTSVGRIGGADVLCQLLNLRARRHGRWQRGELAGRGAGAVGAVTRRLRWLRCFTRLRRVVVAAGGVGLMGESLRADDDGHGIAALSAHPTRRQTDPCDEQQRRSPAKR